MVNPNVFPSRNQLPQAALQSFPPATTINEAGGAAYEFGPEHALAQLAMTGCTNDTFYTTAEEQVNKVKELAAEVGSVYLAKLAIYSRTTGGMKDMPAILLATLKEKDPEMMERVFDTVINNTKMLRNFVTIVRSGVLGSKSFGGRLRRITEKWLDSRSDTHLFEQSIGGNPSLGDILKIVHPTPKTESRRGTVWVAARKAGKRSAPP